MPNLGSKSSLGKKTSTFNEFDDPLDGIENFMTVKNDTIKQDKKPSFDDSFLSSSSKPKTKVSLFDDIDAPDLLNDNKDNKKTSVGDIFGKNDTFNSSFDAKDTQNEQIFGGYMPSTLKSNQPKRNVKFSDEMFVNDEPLVRPKTTPHSEYEKIEDFSKSLPMSDKPKFTFDWLKDDNSIKISEANNNNNKKKVNTNDDWLEIKDSKLSVNSSFTSQNSDLKTSRPSHIETTQKQNEVNILNLDSMDKQVAKGKNYQESISDFASEKSGSNFINEKVDIFKTKDDNVFETFFQKPPLPPPTTSQQLITNTHQLPLPLISNTLSTSNDISLKIRILESENQELRQYLDKLKQDYDSERQSLVETYETRLNYLKENNKKHLNSERELLNEHIELLEKEKLNLMQIHRKKYDELQLECNGEIERLKETHKKSIDLLKQEHEDAIKRIKEFKQNEIEAAFAASSHTRTIESVLNSIHENTKNIDEISHKVQINHMMNLNEKEVELRSREEQLKLQEERINKQLREYEVESKRLHETIDRLENHLAEQMKLVAEERWKGKQQEKKMEALQEALLNEQKLTMEKLTRERADIDRTKDEILIEQKRLMQQVYEEKRKLAEEKAQLNASQQAYKDQQHRDSLQNINLEANLSANNKYIQEESARLKMLEEQLKKERLKIDEKKHEIDDRENKLEQISLTIKQKFIEAETIMRVSNID